MTRLVKLLLRLFPGEFRGRFGAEMIEQVEEDYGRARARGLLPASRFALLTGLDLLKSGLAEHLNPSDTGPRTLKRGGRSMRWILEEWAGDLGQSFRSLKRSPGFTAVTVGTLGLAIGANAGMFSVVNTVLVDPLPYADVDRVVRGRSRDCSTVSRPTTWARSWG